MSESKPAAGRLRGAKSPSYVRAASTPESRASAFTARAMLVSDVAYVLSAAELGYTPAESAHKLLTALFELLDSFDQLDLSKPPGDIVSQREAWMAEHAGREHTAWLHLGRNRGESLRNYLPRLFFRQRLHEQGRLVATLLANLVRRAEPVLEAVSPTITTCSIPVSPRSANISSPGRWCSSGMSSASSRPTPGSTRRRRRSADVPNWQGSMTA